jgi:D-alanyl-D-alanine carboxypeptidase
MAAWAAGHASPGRLYLREATRFRCANRPQYIEDRQVKDGVSRGRAAGMDLTPDALRLKASAAFVIDQRSGEVRLRKNEDAVLPIASLTKLMTALVLTEGPRRGRAPW